MVVCIYLGLKLMLALDKLATRYYEVDCYHLLGTQGIQRQHFVYE